jgi:hypothetical protein
MRKNPMPLSNWMPTLLSLMGYTATATAAAACRSNSYSNNSQNSANFKKEFIIWVSKFISTFPQPASSYHMTSINLKRL